jgi:hypothetical protein
MAGLGKRLLPDPDRLSPPAERLGWPMISSDFLAQSQFLVRGVDVGQGTTRKVRKSIVTVVTIVISLDHHGLRHDDLRDIV